MSFLPRLGPPDVVQHALGLGLLALGQFVEHVAGLVHPASLLTGFAIHFAQGLPEPERTVTHGQLRTGLEAACLQIQEQFRPRLFALTEAILDGDQLLFAGFRGPHDHQDALPVFFQPDVEVNAVRPPIHVAAISQGALVPGFVILLPDLFQPNHGGRRQAGGVRAEQSGQRLAEVAGADAAKVQPGDQLLDALGLAQIRRQNLAGESNTVAVIVHAFVVHTRPFHGDGPEPRLKFTLGGAAVADHQPAAGSIPHVGVLGKVGFHLIVDRHGQHLLGTSAKKVGKHVFRTFRWNLNWTCRILMHRRILLR